MNTRPVQKKYPYEFCEVAKRNKSKESTHKNVTGDPVLQFMLQNAEARFPPKMVYGPNDWLKTQREAGQDLKRYS